MPERSGQSKESTAARAQVSTPVVDVELEVGAREELSRVRREAEDRAAEANREVDRLHDEEEQARLRYNEEVSRIRADREVARLKARQDLAKLEAEEDIHRRRLELDAEDPSDRPRRRRSRRRSADDDDLDWGDLSTRYVDETSDLMRGVTLAYLEGVRTWADIADDLADTVLDAPGDRDSDSRASRSRSGRRRGSTSRSERGGRGARRSSSSSRSTSDVVRDMPADLYTGLLNAVDDYVSVPRRAVDRFYDEYRSRDR